MNYRQLLEQARSDRMDAVIDAAAELFLARGIDSVRMTDIAQAADVGVASLYRYFGTKTTLVIGAGIRLWRRVHGLLDRAMAEAGTLCGAEQIRLLLLLQVTLYREHQPFLRFLSGFDALMLREQVPRDELADYEAVILNVYPVFEQAWRKGMADGSLRSDVDYPLLYRSLTHALMSLCQRFIVGEILPSDDYREAENELQAIIDMAMASIRASKNQEA